MVKVRVCDICRSKDSVRTYRIGKEGQVGRLPALDLCEEHSAPLEELLAAHKPLAVKQGRMGIKAQVVPREQLPKKRAARKRA